MRIVIVGCGSMGKRRARCLRKMGVEAIAAVDPREDRRAEIAAKSGADTFDTVEKAFEGGADFALICVAPHLHQQALMACIEARVPIFCEAPLTMTLAQADSVIAAAHEAGVYLAPSCTYLHSAIHRRISEFLAQETFGRPLAALSYVGQHVADWHPYEDYRGFYASKRCQGGMCFDMLPHDLHLFTHWLGDVRSLACMARRRAQDIETDGGARDVYDVLLDMETGVSLVIHQDMFQRPWGNYRKIMCERGAIEWNWQGLRACAYTGAHSFPNDVVWRDIPMEGYDFEAMYVAELEHAFAAVRGEVAYLLPPERERRILEIVLACEESSDSGRQIAWPAHP